MDTQDVPTSRGLGSSATCIVAGVLAAKYFLGDKVTLDECFQIASQIEGHPDNVAPAMFGGLISSYTKGNEFKYVKYDVSDKLMFNVFVPPFELETHASRGVLPKELGYKDIVFNTSRMANIPYAMQTGNLELLIDMLNDKMHEPYRLPLINGSKEIRDIAHNNNCAFALSGAGPSLLIISDKNINSLFTQYTDWKMFNLQIGNNGAIVKEI